MDPKIVPLRVVAADPILSPPAQEFARRITPRLLAQLADHKEAIIASGSNPLVRMGLKLAFPQFLKVVPHLADTGAQALFDEFGRMTLSELAAKILANNRSRGLPSHPSLNPREDPHAPDR